jgi:hypothetical protein
VEHASKFSSPAEFGINKFVQREPDQIQRLLDGTRMLLLLWSILDLSLDAHERENGTQNEGQKDGTNQRKTQCGRKKFLVVAKTKRGKHTNAGREMHARTMSTSSVNDADRNAKVGSGNETPQQPTRRASGSAKDRAVEY